jgi:hypothetical protein
MVVVAMIMNISPVERRADRGGAAEYGGLSAAVLSRRRIISSGPNTAPTILSHLCTLFQRALFQIKTIQCQTVAPKFVRTRLKALLQPVFT